MKYFRKYFPDSGFSWTVFGFLLLDLFMEKIPFTAESLIWPLFFLSALSLVLFRNEKKFIIVGFFLLTLFSEWTVRQKTERRNLIFTAQDWKSAEKKWRTADIRFEREIKKNFWEVKISHKNFEFPSILRYKTKSELIYDMECPLSAIKINDSDIKNEYLQFTGKYGYIYLSVRQKNCKRLDGRTDERRLVRKRTEKLLEEGKIYDTAKDISLGLIFGDSGYLNDDLKRKAREGGILHLFAASGLHIGVLAAFLYFICKRIPFLDYYTEKIIPLALCFLYLYLLNFPVSLLRAYLFASFFLISQVVFRRMHKMDLILNAAVFIRLYDPDSYLSLSFLLSFCAVAGILLIKEDLDVLLFGEQKSFFSENLTLSLSASLGTFPVLLYYFNSFSFGSIFLNLILVPLTSLILPILYAALILQYFSVPIISEILWVNLEILLRTLALLAVEMGESLGFYREFGEGRNKVLNYYYIIIFFIAFLFIVNSYFIKRKQSELKGRILRISVSSFCFAALIMFCYYGYNVEDTKKYASSELIFSSQNSFLYLKDRHAFLSGSCKYNSYPISISIREKELCRRAESFHIDDETCISSVLRCREKNKFFYISEGRKSKLSESTGFIAEKKSIPKEITEDDGKKIIFYAPHKDSIESLVYSTKSGKGKIAMQFSFRSRDNVSDWNANKGLLGISDSWKFEDADKIIK